MAKRPKPIPLAAGNWKMNGLAAALDDARGIAVGIGAPRVRVALCPPDTLLARMAEVLADTAITVGGQDCHTESSGAHTGDTSAAMLADAGARWVILGHSERRRDHGESSALIARKVSAAVAAGLTPIVCVGETEIERDRNRTLGVVRRQLRDSLPEGFDPGETGQGLVIAYEPVWAIGTGRTPTTAEIATVHQAIRRALVKRFGPAGRGVAILYGGSVKASNAADIFAVPDVNGALVGGASLKAADFVPIVQALEQAGRQPR